jgi:hypothetical protein
VVKEAETAIVPWVAGSGALLIVALVAIRMTARRSESAVGV